MMEQELCKREEENQALKDKYSVLKKLADTNERKYFSSSIIVDELSLQLSTRQLNLKKKQEQMQKIQETINKLEKKVGKIGVETEVVSMRLNTIRQHINEVSTPEDNFATFVEEEEQNERIYDIEKEIEDEKQKIRWKREEHSKCFTMNQVKGEETMKRVENFRKVVLNKHASLSVI